MRNRLIKFYKNFDLAWVFIGSLLFKLFFGYIHRYRFYPDVIIAVRNGKNYLIGMKNPLTTSKTFLGPVLWFFTYERFGIWGLKFVNLLSFVLLFFIVYFIGKKIFSHNTVIIALFLFSFYVGTNLNIIAGEADDNLTVLFFSLGILLYLYRNKVFWASLLMGIGFVFKFSTGIFYLGFVLYLLTKRKWKQILLSALGMLIPFLIINLIDSFHSGYMLSKQLIEEIGFSTWGLVLFKLFSTGMIFAFLISLWTYLKYKTDSNKLFFYIVASYVVYVIATRNAFSVGYIMMQSMVFSSFLIAEFLIKNRYFGEGFLRRFMIGSALISYLLITTLITQHNITHNTRDVSKYNYSGREAPLPKK